MSKQININLFFVILFCIYSCKQTPKLRDENIIPLKAEHIEIIDSLEYNALNLLLLDNIFEIPHKNYIYALHPEENILYKYEFGKSHFEKILNLNTPFRIINYYINNEEEYISCIIDNHIEDAYILKVFDLKDGKVYLEKKIPEHEAYIFSAKFPHILLNGKDFYSSFSPKLMNYPAGYTEKYIQMYWDIENNIVEMLPITYPENYHGKYWGVHYNIDRVLINDSIHAFSFHFNDSIFLYNTNTKKITAHFAGTKQDFIFPNIPFEKISSFHEEVLMDIVYNAPLYFQMSYNTTKGIYTRFFRNKSNQISQVLYDKDFNYIGEFTNSIHSLYNSDDGFHNIRLKDKKLMVEKYHITVDNLAQANAQKNTQKLRLSYDKYLKENFDAGVQKFLEKTKLIPAKNDSIIIYQSTHCASCVQSAALSFLKEKDNKNTTIIVFDQSDKEMLANHIFLSPIVLCQDNSLTQEGYYHHMPHLYFWKGDKVTSSPIVKEAQEENI